MSMKVLPPLFEMVVFLLVDQIQIQQNDLIS
jgi:hypothetical protein